MLWFSKPRFYLGIAHQTLTTRFWGCCVRCAAAQGARTLRPLPRSVRSYISAEGMSLRNAKEFLLRQSRSLRKRRSALRAASLQWRQDLCRAQEAVQDPDSSQLLEGMRRSLEEVSPGRCPCSGAGCHRASHSPGINSAAAVVLLMWAWGPSWMWVWERNLLFLGLNLL